MANLTLKRLTAIQEALWSRLAGEMDLPTGDPEAPSKADYEMALRWAEEQVNKRLCAVSDRYWKNGGPNGGVVSPEINDRGPPPAGGSGVPLKQPI